MTIGLGHYLAVSAILFTLGVLGIFINRKNVIVILMSVELILLSVNINFVAFSSFLNDIVGQVFALLVVRQNTILFRLEASVDDLEALGAQLGLTLGRHGMLLVCNLFGHGFSKEKGA